MLQDRVAHLTCALPLKLLKSTFQVQDLDLKVIHTGHDDKT